MAYDAGGGRDTRSKALERWGSLKNERSSWLEHYRDLSRFILPRNGRFLLTDRNRGDKRHNSIIDSTATKANRTLAAGMQAGMTSPARPWFRLATPDKKLMKVETVKRWLDDVGQLMRDIFASSNLYRALHSIYGELGCFGTGANILLPSYETVIHNHTLTTGEFAIARGREGRINTLYREFEVSVQQMVEDYGYKNCSTQVQHLYDRVSSRDAWVPVLHIIEPRGNEQRNLRSPTAQNMAFKSCYYELNSTENKVLRESGFKRFPAQTPRWDTAGQDIYGNSPGMEALGDVKQLQHQQTRKGQAIDYQVKPPLSMPTSLKGQPNATLPGGVAYHDTVGQNSIKSMFDVNLNLMHLREDLVDIRQRINSIYYVDLFLFLQQLDREGSARQVTAREIAERHEEKLIMLGPVLERLHDELLKPLIDHTFDLMVEAGVLPPPPQELQNQDLEVEFVSMLAQAQRAVGIGSIDRLLGTILAVTQIEAAAGRQPTAVDKLAVDPIIDTVSDMLGIDPDLIVADDKVAIVRKKRDAAMAAQAQMAAAQQMAATAKDAAAAPTDEKNALTDVTSRLTGYSTPEAGV